MSVNIENMRTWVRRLRDPEAKQARGRLRLVNGSMDCLGHACDVSGLGEWASQGRYVVGGYGYVTVLHLDVVKWLGVDGKNPMLLNKFGRPIHATALNDAFEYTLAEIADAIEATWPEVREVVAS